MNEIYIVNSQNGYTSRELAEDEILRRKSLSECSPRIRKIRINQITKILPNWVIGNTYKIFVSWKNREEISKMKVETLYRDPTEVRIYVPDTPYFFSVTSPISYEHAINVAKTVRFEEVDRSFVVI